MLNTTKTSNPLSVHSLIALITLHTLNLLQPIRNWLNHVEIRNARLAHLICRLIPVQCPFERTIYLFNHRVAKIPPLCKLNPLYEEVVALRFRALCYLADECHEDIRCYC